MPNILEEALRDARLLKEGVMAKLKQRDKRPKRKFKPGDIVIPHPSRRDLISVGQGIVLKEVKKTQPDDIVNTDLQLVLVYFAARDVDLYTEARKFARAWVDEPEYEPDGAIMRNTDLEIVKTESGWLDAPSIEEVQMQRFSDVANDIS